MRYAFLMISALVLSSLVGCTRVVSIAELKDGDRKIKLEMISYGETKSGKSAPEEYELTSAGHTVVATPDEVTIDGVSVAIPDTAKLIHVDVAESDVTLTVDGEILNPES